MTIAYNQGNEPRKLACEMLKSDIESLNPRFHINVLEFNWGTYLTKMGNHELPIFITGWFRDYPHQYNFLYAFMHSQGPFASWQGYSNSTVDGYIEALVGPIDEDATEVMSDELQKVYVDECISIPLAQPCTRQWHKSWVQGRYYNPAYSGDYFYHLWPEDLPPGDINGDANVDIYDAIILAGAYNSKLGDLNWNAKADINNDGTVDIYDAIILANHYGQKS
jgi:peptide/nickel transport system substrate-binding protein